MNEQTFRGVLNSWHSYFNPPSSAILPFEKYYSEAKLLPENLAGRLEEYIKNDSKFFPRPSEIRRAVFTLMPDQADNIPGCGVLSGKAATMNRCTAILQRGNSKAESGPVRKPVVCGIELTGETVSPDPYLCMGHYRQYQDYAKNVRGVR